MRTLNRISASTGLLACLLFTSSASAQEILVFVDEVDVGKDTGLTSGGISSSLCTAFEKDRGLTAMCASEVRGMVEMAGQVGAFGQESPLVAGLMKRMKQVRFVVRPFLRRTKGGGLKLLLRMYHAEGTDGAAVGTGKPAGRIVEESDDGNVKKILDRLPAAAARAAAMLHEPRNTPGGRSDTPPPLQ
jgi:hypothetical protein